MAKGTAVEKITKTITGVILELSLDEAKVIKRLVGSVGGHGNTVVYDACGRIYVALDIIPQDPAAGKMVIKTSDVII